MEKGYSVGLPSVPIPLFYLGKQMEHEENKKPVRYSTKQVKWSDKRSTRYRQYLQLVKTFSDDVGEANAGQQALLAMLEVPLRSLQEIRDEFDSKESTLADGRLDPTISKDFKQLSVLVTQIVKEFYSLSGKKATKKRLAPIREIIEGSK